MNERGARSHRVVAHELANHRSIPAITVLEVRARLAGRLDAREHLAARCEEAGLRAGRRRVFVGSDAAFERVGIEHELSVFEPPFGDGPAELARAAARLRAELLLGAARNGRIALRLEQAFQRQGVRAGSGDTTAIGDTTIRR